MKIPALMSLVLFVIFSEMPQNHQDWLLLLQKQESLHRIELQKWHEILMSALKILHQVINVQMLVVDKGLIYFEV